MEDGRRKEGGVGGGWMGGGRGGGGKLVEGREVKNDYAGTS